MGILVELGRSTIRPILIIKFLVYYKMATTLALLQTWIPTQLDTFSSRRDFRRHPCRASQSDWSSTFVDDTQRWNSNPQNPDVSETALSIDSILDDSLAIPARYRTSGMSPKKAHEVLRMTGFIANLIETSELKPRHVVDIGAGQVSTLYYYYLIEF